MTHKDSSLPMTDAPIHPSQLKQNIHQAVGAAQGRFTRFLDALYGLGVEAVPRWAMKPGIAPMHTFHLEPLRYRLRGQSGKAYSMALGEDMGWSWLLCHLDYPLEAKERLLETARRDALAWMQAQTPAKESSGERRVREALEHLFGVPFAKARPAWLIQPGYVHACELDGWNEGLGLAFEFQGQQHYEAVGAFGMTHEALLQRQRTDTWKRLMLQDKGIALLDVSHAELPALQTVGALAAILADKLDGNGALRPFLRHAQRDHMVIV